MDDIEHLRPMLKQGDAEAWRSLVRALAGPLFRYARPLSIDDDSAEEIVQQTFIRLSRAKLKPQGSLRTLAFHIATNLLRDQRRNQATRQRHEQEAAMPEATTDDPSRQAEAKEAWNKALQLPVELREVVLLRYGQGFTAAETAAVLGIPEGTVKTRQRKALESLRGNALAAPALIALEGDLQAAATATQVPTTLATKVEAAIMASIGTKTGMNAGILVLAALLLIGGIGTGAYFLTSPPSGQASQKREAHEPQEGIAFRGGPAPANDQRPAPPVMAGPNAQDRLQSHDASNNAATSPPSIETPGNTGNAAESANGIASDDDAGAGHDAMDEATEEQPSFRAGIAGRVVDYRGEGVANASVHIEYSVANADDWQSGRRQELTKQVTIRADNRGVYTFDITDPRTDEGLYANILHHATEPGTPPVIDPMGRQVHLVLRNGAERTGIRLEVQSLQYQGRVDPDADDPRNPELGSHPYLAIFKGNVVDDQGLPVVGARVQLAYLWWLPSNPRSHRGYEKGPIAETDVTGAFTLTLIGDVRDETVTATVIATASAEGKAASERWSQRDVANGAQQEISFEMFAAGSAMGRVVDSTGEPVKYAYIRAERERVGVFAPISALADIDSEGRFEVGGLAPGNWRIKVNSRTYPSHFGTPREPIEFEVIAGAEIQLPDIVLVPPTTVTIKLLKEDGTALEPGTEIRLSVESDRPGLWGGGQTKVNRNGLAIFRGIEPGNREARLTVTGQDFEEYRLTLNILEGQENDIGEIRLRWARDKAE